MPNGTPIAPVDTHVSQDDCNTPGHRSGSGAGSLWEQMHRDEQRRENAEPRPATTEQELSQAQRTAAG